MRKSLRTIALLIALAGATNAHADVATLNFQGDSSPWDFSATDVNVDTANDTFSFDLTVSNGITTIDLGTDTGVPDLTTGTPYSDTYQWNAVFGDSMGYLGILDVTNRYYEQFDFSSNDFTSNAAEEGTATLSPTPEPGTAILWLTGIVLMILTRKRIAQVLRLDPETLSSMSPH